MRAKELIIESEKIYYHGSSVDLPVGTILSPRDTYEDNWASTDFYTILELYRPPNMLSHKQAVFMCENDEDVDLAGGATDWLFTVKANGPVQKHDMNWSSEISMLISDGYDEDSPEVEEAANNYWSGIPHSSEQVWEYLTPSATILSVEEY